MSGIVGGAGSRSGVIGTTIIENAIYTEISNVAIDRAVGYVTVFSGLEAVQNNLYYLIVSREANSFWVGTILYYSAWKVATIASSNVNVGMNSNNIQVDNGMGGSTTGEVFTNTLIKLR